MLFQGWNPSLDLQRPSPSEAPYCLSECRWEEINNESGLFVDGLARQLPVALSVMFDNESGRLFSAVRVVLCCNRGLHDKKWRDWAIWDMGSVVDTVERYMDNPTPLNDPSMPKCTVMFEMITHQESAHGPISLAPALRASCDPRLPQQSSIYILLDREIPLPPDTRAVTLSFITNFVTCTWMDLSPKLQPITHYSVAVLPIITPRQIPYKQLPVEILMTIFCYIAEAPKNRGWRRDLLSSALVCRQWTCSLDLLLWDLHIPHGHRHRVTKPPNIHALAKVITEQPVLAPSINHLSTRYLRGPLFLRNGDSASLHAFISSLITTLGSARNLRTLELTHLDVSQTEALSNALCDLPALHTFITGQLASCGVISIVQLAHCLATWPSLKSLTIHGLQPPTLTEPLAALRLPACALTKLHLEGVSMTDAELIHFMVPSFKTLESVILDDIGISNAGLRTFLEGISQNVFNLTLRNVGRMHGTEERALDVTIVKMRCLKELFIKGDVATELMVNRRASLFRMSGSNKGLANRASLPMVQLSFGLVPELPATIGDGEWPGWDIKKPYTGPCCGGVHID